MRTVTSCDKDACCRQVLSSLHESYRPEHVGGPLEDRVSRWYVDEALKRRDVILKKVEEKVNNISQVLGTNMECNVHCQNFNKDMLMFCIILV